VDRLLAINCLQDFLSLDILVLLKFIKDFADLIDVDEVFENTILKVTIRMTDLSARNRLVLFERTRVLIVDVNVKVLLTFINNYL
jgi:hypothetical protein